MKAGSTAGNAATSPPLQEQRLPRYTSYPPATEFTTLSSEAYTGWLSHLPRNRPVSLYLHIPFCNQLCWFCGCFTKITHHYSPVAQYLELLLQEIQSIGKLSGKLNIGHIHFGGGSPTILAAGDFSRIMKALNASFAIDEHTEIAVEIDPRTVDKEKIGAYAQWGVSRVSLGVQDFEPDVQTAVNRIQPYELVADVVQQLRTAGIRHINLDLMYGLPRQTVQSVAATAEKALCLMPSRLAVFGYAHVPWMRKHQQVLNDLSLAGADERILMFNAMSKVLTTAGYIPIGIDHYARPDDSMAIALSDKTLQRNFQGYTTDRADTVLGFGLSAIGSLPQGYVQNTSSIGEYRQATAENKPPVTRGLVVSDEDRMRRDIISQLMCYYRVDMGQIAERFQKGIAFEKELSELQSLKTQGFIRYDDNVLHVTEQGRPYVRTVCAAFDQYLHKNINRFSLAV